MFRPSVCVPCLYITLLAATCWSLLAFVALGANGDMPGRSARIVERVERQSDRGDTVGVVVADLKTQLEVGLKARRPSEFAFIAHVVSLVEQKRLPIILVKGTFQWARYKKPYPIQFFERALRIRAAELGIEI